MSYKFVFCYILMIISNFKVVSFISVADKGILPLEKYSIGIQFFIDIVNENRVGFCKIHSRVKKCCLTDLDEEDCKVMEVIGEALDVVKPRDRKTLVYVFPTLYPYDIEGYCDVVVDYYCFKNKDRLHVNIPFDTKVVNARRSDPLLKSYISDANSFVCDTLDQNSLDNCVHINCDAKYVGRRSYYDENIHRCIPIPVCIGDVDKELPNLVYVPFINVCKNLENILTIQDIYAMTTGLGTVTESPKKEDDLKVEFKSNCSTISQNLYLLKDLMNGRLCPCGDFNTTNVFQDGSKCAALAIIFCVLSICAVLISFIFCVNITIWVHGQWSRGNINAFVVNIRSKFKRTEKKRQVSTRISRVNSEVRNKLLREVITKDVPIELRDSVVSVCDRMEEEFRKKKRYRSKDIGSQISLQKEARVLMASSSSTESLCSENDVLLN